MNNEVMQKILFELSTRICELENEVDTLKNKCNFLEDLRKKSEAEE